MARLSSFLILLTAFMLVISFSLAPFMAELNDNYEVENYNSSKASAYDKLSEISQDTEEVKDKAIDLQSRSGVLDVLGGFFEAAYDTVKIAAGSFSLFDTMKNQAIDDVGVANSYILKTGITIIAILAVFLGIIISLVVKRDV